MRHTHYYIFLLFLLSTVRLAAQDTSRNYVKTTTMLDNAGSNSIVEVQYYDDLGRPDLFSTTGLGTSGVPVYTSMTYDAKGRVREEYMPSLSKYGQGDRYVLTRYDGLNRPIMKESPGLDWKDNDKGVSRSYSVNSASEVKRYVAHVGSNMLTPSGTYAAKTLNVETETDEDGHFVSVYTDQLGRKVLERRNGDNDTYFVYDEKNQLRFVLSPEYQTTANLSLYGYQYWYDAKGRLIRKQLPGCGYVEYWYDNNDRVQFMRDGVLRSRGLYRFTLYDPLGRLVVQGTCTECSPVPSFTKVTYLSGSGICGTGYVVSQSNLITNPTLEKACYYDDYSFISGASAVTALNGSDQLSRSSSGASIGLQTGMVKRHSDGSTSVEAVYYDNQERPIDARRLMSDGTLLSETIEYSFTGKPTKTIHVIKKGNATYTAQTDYTYNTRNNQPVKAVLTIGGSTKPLIQTTYDTLGRLSSVKRGTNAGTVVYGYNERDWVSSITAGDFQETLYYSDGPGNYCYNGNVSAMTWKASNESTTRGYLFTYDANNRLTDADYGEGSGLGDNTDRYTEKVLSYSANGAIKKMQRYGKKTSGNYGLVDDLTVTLNGNQLMSVSDAAGTQLYSGSFDFKDKASSTTEYTYNANGALLTDANKGISLIGYDALGSPRRVQFTNGSTIEFVYDSDGTKLKTIHHMAVANITVPIGGSLTLNASNTLSSDSTEYLGRFIRENGIVSKYLFDGGYCTLSSTGIPTLHFFTRDHLGNNREVVSENGAVEQITHYYPFGGIYGDIGTDASLQKYKYNGKELDRTHGLDTYDYGARSYDAALPLWDRVDPLAEKYYHLSPYVYCHSSPTTRIDIDGADDFYSLSGEFLFSDNKKTDYIIIRNEWLQMMKNLTNAEWICPDVYISQANLTAEAYSRIFTYILSKMDDVSIDDIHNGKVSVTVFESSDDNLGKVIVDKYNDARKSDGTLAQTTWYKNIDRPVITAYIHPKGSEERELFSSISNVQNTLGAHEFLGHYKNGWIGNRSHAKVVPFQRSHKSWGNTTDIYKNYINKVYAR